MIDKKVYSDLVKENHAKVFQLCFGLLGTADQADDAAQDIFVKAYERLETFKERSSFSTWLFRLATNHCLDLLRKRERRKTESLENIHIEASEKNSSTSNDLAHHLLSQLETNHRLLLTMREIQGLSYQEIADILNLSLDAVKAKLQRARRDLQKKFDTFQVSQTSK